MSDIDLDAIEAALAECGRADSYKSNGDYARALLANLNGATLAPPAPGPRGVVDLVTCAGCSRTVPETDTEVTDDGAVCRWCDGEDRDDERPPMCRANFALRKVCVLPDGHAGEHSSTDRAHEPSAPVVRDGANRQADGAGSEAEVQGQHGTADGGAALGVVGQVDDLGLHASSIAATTPTRKPVDVYFGTTTPAPTSEVSGTPEEALAKVRRVRDEMRAVPATPAPAIDAARLAALVEVMDDAVPAHAYVLIDASVTPGTGRLSYSMDGAFTKAEPLYRKHDVRRWLATLGARPVEVVTVEEIVREAFDKQYDDMNTETAFTAVLTRHVGKQIGGGK